MVELQARSFKAAIAKMKEAEAEAVGLAEAVVVIPAIPTLR